MLLFLVHNKGAAVDTQKLQQQVRLAAGPAALFAFLVRSSFVSVHTLARLVLEMTIAEG